MPKHGLFIHVGFNIHITNKKFIINFNCKIWNNENTFPTEMMKERLPKLPKRGKDFKNKMSKLKQIAKKTKKGRNIDE